MAYIDTIREKKKYYGKAKIWDRNQTHPESHPYKISNKE